MVPQLMIEQAGSDAAKVKWLSVGGSAARLQALITKRVDGAALNSSFTDRALQYGGLHVVGSAIKDLPNFIYGWEVVSANAVAQKREALQAFTTGTMQGVRWAIANPDQAAAISHKILPDVPGAELVAAANGFAKSGYYNQSGKLPKEAWDFTIASLLKLGNIDQRIAYEDVILDEFVKTAEAQIGPSK
jgi:ABC-type nitrate/sulfonate/bicarbonate transport system substrate-binding protein